MNTPINSKRNPISQAKILWENGEYLESGKKLFEDLSRDDQVTRAVAILDLTAKWLDVRMCGVWELQRVSRKRRRWRGAYQSFHKIRKTTLRLEGRKRRSPVQERLLCLCGVAENVAKVIYNATDPMDPFDEDAGWWIVPCVRHCVDCLDMPAFEDAVVSLMLGTSKEERSDGNTSGGLQGGT